MVLSRSIFSNPDRQMDRLRHALLCFEIIICFKLCYIAPQKVFLGMSDHDEDEFCYPDEIQISVRWPTTVTAKANCSRQKQITHGKSKSLTAKATYSRQNQIAHGKTKSLTAKPNSLTAKPNSVHRKDLGTRLERARCMVAVEDVLSELWVPYAKRGSEVLYPMWYR